MRDDIGTVRWFCPLDNYQIKDFMNTINQYQVLPDELITVSWIAHLMAFELHFDNKNWIDGKPPVKEQVNEQNKGD